MTQNVKLIVYVPLTHADSVREALGRAGAGEIGNYRHCSFSSLGTGRFLGNEDSAPVIGQKGVLEAVQEERIEVTVQRDILSKVIAAMKAVHPYEEVAFDIYALEDFAS